MMDYTQHPHPRRNTDAKGERLNDGVWWAPSEEIVRWNKLANAEYRRKYGLRSEHIHLTVRYCMRTTKGYGVGVKRWWYVNRYPDDVDVYCTVWDDGSVTFDGWMYYKDVLINAEQVDGIGNRIITGPFEPMDTFVP